jgi:glycosyltransferase involved in cell wall biosynthesis
VGRFVDKKAPYLTILAFKKVSEEFPTAKLIMIGNGPLLNTCKNLAEAMNLTDKIEFKGVLKPLEIQSLFEDSLAFVQHSIVADDGDAEGTPVAVLEAQAAALPVISTWHAGIPDVVIHEETGMLVKERDVEGMANNMLRLLREEGLAKRLGESGRKRVKNNFTLEKHLGILESVLMEAISKKQINN